MAEIKLTQGKVALVDDEDFEFLNQWKWYARFDKNTCYAGRNEYVKNDDNSLKQYTVLMHRKLMNAPSGLHIDHINKNGLDNRKSNLRIVTSRVNQHNRIKQSFLIGAYKCNHYKINPYYSKLEVNGKVIRLGTFKTPEEAHEAYMNAYKSLTINNSKP